MTNPVPTAAHQIERFDQIDTYIAAVTDSETKNAIRAVIHERIAQVHAGYDAEHDAVHGSLHPAREALRRLSQPLVLSTAESWKVRVQAAALILASLEAEAYDMEAIGETRLPDVPAANAAYQVRQAALDQAITAAKSVADRDKYTPQESAAAWDVVDALVQLRTAGEHVTPDPDQDDRDGKQIARAAEWVGEGLDDGEADRG